MVLASFFPPDSPGMSLLVFFFMPLSSGMSMLSFLASLFSTFGDACFNVKCHLCKGVGIGALSVGGSRNIGCFCVVLNGTLAILIFVLCTGVVMAMVSSCAVPLCFVRGRLGMFYLYCDSLLEQSCRPCYLLLVLHRGPSACGFKVSDATFNLLVYVFWYYCGSSVI